MFFCIVGIFFVFASNTSDKYGVAVWLPLRIWNRDVPSTDFSSLDRLLDTSHLGSFCHPWRLTISSTIRAVLTKQAQQDSCCYRWSRYGKNDWESNEVNNTCWQLDRSYGSFTSVQRLRLPLVSLSIRSRFTRNKRIRSATADLSRAAMVHDPKPPYQLNLPRCTLLPN